MSTPAPRSNDESDFVFPRPFEKKRLIIPFCAIALGILITFFAAPVHGVVYEVIRRLPLISKFFHTYNHFATAGAVIAVIIAVWFLDPKRRNAVGVLLLAIAASSSVVEPIKQITGRARPPMAVTLHEDRHIRQMEEYIERYGHPKMAVNTDDKWLWLSTFNRPFGDDRFSSFPSGHAAGAFVMASFLTALYPRVWGLWFTIAVMCALARVEMRRHYPCDILVGGAIGFLMSNLVFSLPISRRLGIWFAGVFGSVLVFLRLDQPDSAVDKEQPSESDQPDKAGSAQLSTNR